MLNMHAESAGSAALLPTTKNPQNPLVWSRGFFSSLVLKYLCPRGLTYFNLQLPLVRSGSFIVYQYLLRTTFIALTCSLASAPMLAGDNIKAKASPQNKMLLKAIDTGKAKFKK